MTILLTRPRPDRETIGLQHLMVCEPLELEYLAAVVESMGHTPILVDMILERKRLDFFLDRHRPRIVAVTGYITHVHLAKAYCRRAKRRIPDCVTIVGGVHAEVIPRDFCDESIDCIVRDDALETFRRVIRAVEDGQDPARVPGVWSKDAADPPAYTPPSETLRPARHSTARYRDRYYYLFHRPCALLKTSYGCPSSCSFCYCRAITRGAYSARPLDGVMDELSSIAEEDVYMVDDNFLVSRARVLDFCRQLETRGIRKRFLVYGRADFIAGNPDVIEIFARQGLRAVIVGLESFDQKELDQYQKNSRVLDNETAVRVLSRYGVDCYATLMIPATWIQQDFRKLRQWLRTLDLAYFNLQPLTPLPGTESASAVPPDEFVVSREEFAKWDLAHVVVKPVNLSARRYYANILWLYCTVLWHPSQIRKHLARHGYRQNLKMFVAVTRISLHYVEKWMQALWRRT